MVGDPTVAELAHHRRCAPRSEDLGAGVLLRLPHGRGLWDGPADLRGHEVELFACAWWIALPMYTRARQCRMPTACSSDWHSMDRHMALAPSLATALSMRANSSLISA